jgi:hypothetical protein
MLDCVNHAEMIYLPRVLQISRGLKHCDFEIKQIILNRPTIKGVELLPRFRAASI